MQNKDSLCLWMCLTYPQHELWRGWGQNLTVSGNRKRTEGAQICSGKSSFDLLSRVLKLDSRGVLVSRLQECLGLSPAPCYSANSEKDDGAWFLQSFGVLVRGILLCKCCTLYLFFSKPDMHTNKCTAAESLPSFVYFFVYRWKMKSKERKCSDC